MKDRITGAPFGVEQLDVERQLVEGFIALYIQSTERGLTDTEWYAYEDIRTGLIEMGRSPEVILQDRGLVPYS